MQGPPKRDGRRQVTWRLVLLLSTYPIRRSPSRRFEPTRNTPSYLPSMPKRGTREYNSPPAMVGDSTKRVRFGKDDDDEDDAGITGECVYHLEHNTQSPDRSRSTDT